ncbi:MAG: SDR family oxidoreductase [Deltaproteobacteria bacterium]|nr:SDR family oxidoreductase [Deltaproteobacteria bacterium]
MDLQLKDKVVIVTGGAKGIGQGITRSFAAEGAIVAIFDRNPEQAQALVSKVQAAGGRAACFSVELTDRAGIARAVADVLKTYGAIDVVVNNAGVNDGVALDAGVEKFEESLRRNLVHYYAVVHGALGALKASRGTVVNVGSKVAVTGQGGTSGYAAAKGAIDALTREWAVELAPHGVRVNCVVPAEVMTPLYERWLNTLPDPQAMLGHIQNAIPLGRRMTTIPEIADAVVFVASARSSHTTGQILYVDGGYVHLDRKTTIDLK